MIARILSFRRGRRTQTNNQFLLEAEGLDSRGKAAQLIGKRVVWKSPASREIFGRVTDTHGNKGVVRARFSRGLPGTVLGKNVEILEK
jgi:large subunit ribosomal protein L35Ae